MEVSKDQVKHLRRGLFQDFFQCGVLDLRNRSISDISASAFYGCENLQMLYLGKYPYVYHLVQFINFMIEFGKMLIVPKEGDNFS